MNPDSAGAAVVAEVVAVAVVAVAESAAVVAAEIAGKIDHNWAGR